MRQALLAVSFAIGLALLFDVRASAYPGHCEIEIINSMNDDVTVHGTFDDGHPLQPFRIHRHDAPHYISLFYHGYCHSGMRLVVDAHVVPHNVTIYSAWTHPNSTVRLIPH